MNVDADFYFATVDDVERCTVCNALSLTYLRSTGEPVHVKCHRTREEKRMGRSHTKQHRKLKRKLRARELARDGQAEPTERKDNNR